MEVRYKKILMIQVVLSDSEHNRLISIFPPKHPNVYAHHMTVAFKPTKEQCERYSKFVGQEIEMPVITEVSDDKAQALLIDSIYSENEFPHITVSTAEGTKPSYSNQLIANNTASLFMQGPEGAIFKGTLKFILKNKKEIDQPFELVD